MPQTITLDDKPYVVIPRDEYDRLTRAARLPELPELDTHGNYPAVEYAQASLARKIILRREAAGWSQAELARRSGVRVETLYSLESGKVAPTLTTVDKLDRALRAAESAPRLRKRKKNA